MYGVMCETTYEYSSGVKAEFLDSSYDIQSILSSIIERLWSWHTSDAQWVITSAATHWTTASQIESERGLDNERAIYFYTIAKRVPSRRA